MPVQALPPSNRPQSSIQPLASVPAAQVLESPAKQSATLKDLPNELLINIFERCLPKDMCNFSLVSTFFRQLYYSALHTLFQPRTGESGEEIAQFLASKEVKQVLFDTRASSSQGMESTTAQLDSYGSIQKIFSHIRQKQICRGDLFNTVKLLLDCNAPHTDRTIQRFIDIGLVKLETPYSPKFVEILDAHTKEINPSTLLEKEQWDFIINYLSEYLSQPQNIDIRSFLSIPYVFCDIEIGMVYYLCSINDMLSALLQIMLQSNMYLYKRPQRFEFCPIYQAVLNRDVYWLKYFVEAGLKIYEPYGLKNYINLAFYIVNEGHLDILKLFIQAGLNKNVSHRIHGNLLNFALKQHHLPIAEFLIESGVDLHIKDKDGNTLLHIVLEEYEGNCNEVIKLLVASAQWHANYSNIKNRKGNTPLAICALEKKNLSGTLTLLNHGASINISDFSGKSLLHKVIEKGGPLITQVFLNKYIYPDILLEEPEPSPYYWNKKTSFLKEKAICHAVKTEDFNTIKILLDNGVDIYIKNDAGKVIFHHCLTKGASPIAEIFLYKYVYPYMPLENHIYTHSSKNKFNWLLQRALHIAIGNDHVVTAKILLENGAKVGGYHNENEEILPYVLQKNTPSILKICLQQYIKQNSASVSSSHKNLGEDNLNSLLGYALYSAVEKEDIPAVNALLNYGTSVYIQNDDGEILLNKIIKEGLPSLVEVFLKKYIHPSMKSTKDSLASLDRMTLVLRALHYAVKNADVGTMHLLLEKQAHCFDASYLFAMVKTAIQNGQRQIAMHLSHAVALKLVPEWLTWFLITPILFFAYLRAIFSLEKSHPDCNNTRPKST